MLILHRSHARFKALYLITAFLLVFPAIFPNSQSVSTPILSDPSGESAQDLFAALPLQFTANLERESNSAAYPWALVGGGLLLGPGKLLYHLEEPIDVPGITEMPQKPSIQPGVDLEVEWVGTNLKANLRGNERLAGKIHYFRGDKAGDWRTGLPAYDGVRTHNLYPGVELLFDGKSGKLKSQYSVKAYADPGQIRWRYPEGTELRVDVEIGDLHVYQGGRLLLTEKAPEAWQLAGEKRQPVRVSYVVTKNEVSFAVGSYDSGLELFIDPVVEFSTYIGGGTFASGDDVAVDADGYIYITGRTLNNKFYVAKIDQTTKTFVYTALIGTNLSGSVYALAVDTSRNAYITGEIFSGTFPTQNPLQSKCSETADAFVAKLNPDGSGLLFGTYLCGGGDDYGNAITVDADQRVYVAGTTTSSDFPVTPGAADKSLGGAYDGFIAVLDTLTPAALNVTYLGGNKLENLTDIHLGEPDSLYVLGLSNSSDYPVLNPIASFHGGTCWYDTCYDAVLTKMNRSDATLLYSTFLGGTGSDMGQTLDADSLGNVYLVGVTDSNDLPLVNPIQIYNYQGGPAAEGEFFVMKVNPSGSGLLYSTYLGGPGTEQSGDITLVDSTNGFIVSGNTSDCFPPFSFFPLTQQVNFLLQLDPAGFPTYFNYLSGHANGFPGGLAVDEQHSVYVIGSTRSTNFPLTNPISTTFSYAYLVKLAQQSKPYQPKPNDVFLPLLMKSIPSIYGWVTEYGCGVAGISLELRYYNGTAWATRATTTTAEDGKYSFAGAPSLKPGERYYVRYYNPTNPNRLWTWGTPILLSYQAGKNVLLSVFDITDLYLNSPADGAGIYLPYTFQWWARLVTPDDSYDFNLVEYYGEDYWYTQPLGYVSSYKLNTLPNGFNAGEPQFWYVGINSPDGGYGESYDAYLVFFHNTGNNSLTIQALPEHDRLERLDQIEERRLKEVEEAQPCP